MRAALLLVVLASCYTDINGETCVSVLPGDGTCPSGGESSYDYEPPPPRVLFDEAALAPGHAIVLQTGAEGDRMWYAPLDPVGRLEHDLAELVLPPGARIAMWPGPDGTALLTARSYHDNGDRLMAVLLDATGRPSAPMIVNEGGRVHQLEVVFDGEAYLAVWNGSYTANAYQLRRIFPDGSVGPLRIPPVNPDYELIDKLALATDGAGGAVLVQGLASYKPTLPTIIQATSIVDGEVVASRTIAADEGETCLGSGVALFAARDGYHVLATRRSCTSYGPPVLVDVRLDGTERPSTLPLTSVPNLWVAARCPTVTSTTTSSRSDACTGGFFAYDATGAWLIDDLLTTATRSRWLDGASLLAITSTATGYIAAFGHDGKVELVQLAGAEDRVTIAESYVLPQEGGCNAGGGAALAPAFAVLLLLYTSSARRRWRKRRSGSDPARSSAAR